MFIPVDLVQSSGNYIDRAVNTISVYPEELDIRMQQVSLLVVVPSAINANTTCCGNDKLRQIPNYPKSSSIVGGSQMCNRK